MPFDTDQMAVELATNIRDLSVSLSLVGASASVTWTASKHNMQIDGSMESGLVEYNLARSYFICVATITSSPPLTKGSKVVVESVTREVKDIVYYGDSQGLRLDTTPWGVRVL